MRRLWIAAGLLVCSLFLASPASARVVRIDVASRAPVLNGKPFGRAGAYEKIVGRVVFEVLPDDPHNRAIVDLENAPRRANGAVEFSADILILRPKDGRKGNGALLLEVSNRGEKALLAIVNGARSSRDPSEESEFGDGWLMRQGYAVAFIGWQWDTAEDQGRLRLHAPVARNPDGTSITGLLRDDISLAERTQDIPLGHILVGAVGGTEYPAASPDDRRNTLTVRDAPLGSRRTIPRSQWSFAHVVDGKLTPSDRHVHLRSGFRPGKLYELVYVVRDPVVAGLGLAAVRDFASHAKYDRGSVVAAKRVYAAGISQCGRFLRHFLWAGFNADEKGRRVLDGVLAHVAGAGRGSFNHRFAQPSRDAQPWASFFYPTDLFPFTDRPERDPVTGERAGLLDAAHAARVAPKVFYTNTSYEYWGRSAALVHVTPDGKRDARIADDTRVYTFTGLQHFSRGFPPDVGTGSLKGRNRQNPNPVRWYWRAMITNMNAWVKDGVAPPPSRHPALADGTLIPLQRLRFPKIPGVVVPRHPARAHRLDFGPRWPKGIIDRHPPRVGRPYPLLVPQVDRDGNDRGGVTLPQLRVPLATYTPWNLRDRSIGAADQMVSFLGSYLPFAKTAAERRRTRDPRPSIAERYRSRSDYLAKFRAAAMQLVAERWLLVEDVPAMMDRAGQEWDEVTR